MISQTGKATWGNEPSYRLPLDGGSLAPQDILQLREVLDEGHHLGLEALRVHILHGGHLEAHSHVVFSPEQWVRPAVSGKKRESVTRQPDTSQY